jgi:DNA replication and repair protein RecF
LGKIPVVMVVPNEVYTFVHVAEERRVFLNQTLVQVDTDYFSKLITYNLCQKQRMATLKWCKINERMDEELIESYEKKMLEPALYISRKRQELIQSINPLIRKYSKLISGDEQDSVLEYSTNVQSDLLQRWREEREIDIQTKRIKTGIHRDKLECKMNGQTIHNYGSQGQIKTLVMALRLAQLEYLMQHTGKKPILLLDDLFAKLDENRVMRLLELIDQMGIEQCMITDTHLDRAVKLSKILQSKSGIIIHKRNKFVGYA